MFSIIFDTFQMLLLKGNAMFYSAYVLQAKFLNNFQRKLCFIHKENRKLCFINEFEK